MASRKIEQEPPSWVHILPNGALLTPRELSKVVFYTLDGRPFSRVIAFSVVYVLPGDNVWRILLLCNSVEDRDSVISILAAQGSMAYTANPVSNNEAHLLEGHWEVDSELKFGFVGGVKQHGAQPSANPPNPSHPFTSQISSHQTLLVKQEPDTPFTSSSGQPDPSFTGSDPTTDTFSHHRYEHNILHDNALASADPFNIRESPTTSRYQMGAGGVRGMGHSRNYSVGSASGSKGQNTSHSDPPRPSGSPGIPLLAPTPTTATWAFQPLATYGHRSSITPTPMTQHNTVENLDGSGASDGGQLGTHDRRGGDPAPSRRVLSPAGVKRAMYNCIKAKLLAKEFRFAPGLDFNQSLENFLGQAKGAEEIDDGLADADGPSIADSDARDI